jgi:uncharacterized membrane protein
MILSSPLTRSPALLVSLLSGAAIVATQVATPSSSAADEAFSPLLRLLLIPGQTGIWFVLYPVLPWVGLTGLGMAFAGALASASPRLCRRSFWWGAAALISFIIVRAAGGFGNLHVPVQRGWVGFLNVTKYPPSLAFVLLTLGVDLLLLAAFAAAGARRPQPRNPLLVFGRTPLFFYVVHLYVFALIGFAFPHGASLAVVYPVWIVGLLIMYPLCARYERFKSQKPADSLWRMF